MKRGLRFSAFLLLLWLRMGNETIAETQDERVALWDTGRPFAKKVEIDNRSAWQVVPHDMERDYSFKGDAVVESKLLLIAVHSSQGRIVVYSKLTGGGKKERISLTPGQAEESETRQIAPCKIFGNSPDKVSLRISFVKGSEGQEEAILSLGRDEMIQISPGKNMERIYIEGETAYGLIPTDCGTDRRRIADAVYDPQEYPGSARCLHIPSENYLLCLLKGGDGAWIATWPLGEQKVRLMLSPSERPERLIERVEIELDNKDLHLCMLSTPGVWFAQNVDSSYVENRVTLNWRPPLMGGWRLRVKGRLLAYPVDSSPVKSKAGDIKSLAWSEGEKVTLYFRKSKGEVAPGGILIYPPYEFVTRVVRQVHGDNASAILFQGYPFRSYGRESKWNVQITPHGTCGSRASLQRIFEAGREVVEKEVVKAYTDDIAGYTWAEWQRMHGYLHVSEQIQRLCCQTKERYPDIAFYLDEMEAVVKKMDAAYEQNKPKLRSMEYVIEEMIKLRALCSYESPENLPAFMAIDCTSVAGTAEETLSDAVFMDTIAELVVKAGLACVEHPEAARIAKEIRRRARMLIW